MPRQPPGGMNPMMMGQRPPLPKGDIGELWRMLGVDFSADQIVWQKYNPYPKIEQFPEEFVFIGEGEGAKEPFGHKDAISARLKQPVLLPFPGWMNKLNVSALEFVPLLRTGKNTGTVSFAELREDRGAAQRGAHGRGVHFGRPHPRQAEAESADGRPAGCGEGNRRGEGEGPCGQGRRPGRRQARRQARGEARREACGKARGKTRRETRREARGETRREARGQAEAAGDQRRPRRRRGHDQPAFFQLREQAEIPELGIRLDFDNVTFVLNTLDELAGDTRFIAVRSHRPQHRTLTRIEEQTKAAKSEAADQREKYYKECKKKEEDEQAELDKRIAELKSRKDANAMDLANELAIAMGNGQRRLESDQERFRQERDKAVTQIETKLNAEVRSVQKSAKWLAVLLPPILPLLVGAYVFAARRVQEREGVSRKRLR